MNTPIDINDPRLIDLVLGELEPAEASKLNAELQLPENREALKETEALKMAIDISKTALNNETATSAHALSDMRRQAVLEKARLQDEPTRKRSTRWGTHLLAAAAMLLFCLGLAAYFVNNLQSPTPAMVALNNQTDARAPANTGKQFPRENSPLEISSTLPIAAESSEEKKREADSTAETPDGDKKSVPASIPTPEPETVASENVSPVSSPPPVALSVPEAELVAPETVSAHESEPWERVSVVSAEQEGKEVLVEKSAPGLMRDTDVQSSSEREDDVYFYNHASSLPGEPADTGIISPDEIQSLGYSAASPQAQIPRAESDSVSEEHVMSDDSHSDGDLYGGSDPIRLNANYVRGQEAVYHVDSYIVPPPRPLYPRGESYSEIKEQPFLRADEAPLSTFSLHPDTAAYTNIKRFLEQGQRPPVDAVRIEEMINYFRYDYPQPSGENPFSVNIEVGPCPWANGHLLAKIGLQGRDLPRQERPAANLVFLIDTSGSMNEANRLPLVKESLKSLIEELEPYDRVGLVTYAGESRVALESSPVSQKDRIMASIETLNAAGTTHGSAGITDAYQMAQDHFIKDGINRIILATDGDFNVGITSREGLLSLIAEKRKTGIFLTVLGYGMGNLKDDNLELLATRGNGNYAYIDSYREARRILVEELTGTLAVIAKDAKIQVEFNPAAVRSYRLIGFENRQLAHRDFNDDSIDAGEIGSGHSVTALYQIVPVGAPSVPGVDELRYGGKQDSLPVEDTDTSGELMFVKLRYKHPGSDSSALVTVPVPVGSVTLTESSEEFRFVAAVAAFGLALRDSAFKGDFNFDEIRKLAASALDDNESRKEFLDLVVTAKTVIAP